MLSLTPHSAQFFNIVSLPFTPSGFVASISTWSIPNGWLVEEARVQKPGTPGIPALAKADDLGTVSSAWRTISFKIQTLYHELALRTYLHIQTYPETGSFTTPSPSFFSDEIVCQASVFTWTVHLWYSYSSPQSSSTQAQIRTIHPAGVVWENRADAYRGGILLCERDSSSCRVGVCVFGEENICCVLCWVPCCWESC